MAKHKSSLTDVTPADAVRLRDLAAGWRGSEAELTVGPADARALAAVGCPLGDPAPDTGWCRVKAPDLVAAVDELPDDPAELLNDDGEPEAERLARQSPRPAARTPAPAGGAAQTARKAEPVAEHRAARGDEAKADKSK